MTTTIKNFLATAAFIFLSLSLQAADRYWISTTTSNWNNTANWSTTSGGSGGASVPTSADRSFFNSSGNGSCNIDANVNVYGMSIAGYTGTITQTSSYTIIIGTYDFDQSSGTFVGGSGYIDVNDDFTMTGGTFTSTSGVLYVAGHWTTSSGGTFNHNDGTVQYDPTGGKSINVNSSQTYYNLTFAGNNQVATVQSSDILIILNTLTLNDGYVNYTGTAGYFDLRGNLSIGSSFDGGTYPLKFTGSAATQTWYGYYADKFDANVTIAKSSGKVQLTSNLTMDGQNQNLYLTSGTLDVNAKSVLIHLSAYVNTLTINGSATITGGGSIICYRFAQSTGTLSTSGATTLRTYDDFELTGGTFNWGSGIITVDDDFTLTAGTFNAPSSTLYLTGSYSNYSSATFVHNNGTVEFNGNGSETINVNSSESFYNFTMNKGGQVLTVQTSDILVINNTLTLSDGYINYTNTVGYIDAKGNVSIGSGYDGGTEPLRFSGTGTQTYYGYYADKFDANITINKASGEVQLISNLTLDGQNQSLILTSGTLNVNGYAVNIHLSAYVNTLTVNGSSTITGSGSIICYRYAQSTGTLSVSGSLTLRTYDDFDLTGGTFNWGSGTVDVDDDFTLSAGTFNAPSSTLYIGGSYSNYSTATYNHNNGTIHFDGNGAETINVNAKDTFYDFYMNKLNATLTVQSNDKFIVKGTLTLNDGYINATGTVQGMEAQGNVVVNSGFDGGTEPLKFTGSVAVQTLTLASSGLFNGDITINKSSGEVKLLSNITMDAQNQILYTTAGTFNLNSYSVVIHLSGYSNQCYVNGTFAISGSGSLTCYQFVHASGALSITGTSTLTVHDDFTVTSGTFTGGSGYINVDDDFILNGGTCNAPSGILYVEGNFTMASGATFNPGSGSVYFDGTQDTYFNVISSQSFNNVRLDKTSSKNLYIYGNDVLIVNGTTTLNDGYLNSYSGTGTMRVNGNLDVESNFDGGAASVVLEFAGSNNQTWDQTGATSNLDADIWINKTGGELDLASALTLNQQDQDIYFYQGTLDLNGYSIVLYDSYYGTGTFYVQTGTSYIKGTGALTAYMYTQSSGTFEFTGAATFTLYQDFTLNSGTFTGYSGYINVDDDFTLNGGTFNSTSGTFYLEGNFTMASGSTFNPGTGTVSFDGTQDTYFNVVTTETLYNMKVDKSSAKNLYVYTGDYLVVTGTATFNDGYINSYNGTGYIQVQGNVDVESNFDGGSYNIWLEFTGSNTQTFDLTGATSQLDCNILINKTGGQVNLVSALTMNQQSQSFYMQQGTFNINANNVLVYDSYYGTGTLVAQTNTSSIIGSGTFTAYNYSQTSGTLSMGGTVNLSFYDDYTINGGTFTGGAGYINVDDDFNLTSGTFTAPSGIMYVAGNFTYSAGTFTHNSGTVQFDGTQHTYANMPPSITFYNLTLNKSGGSYATYVYNNDILITEGTLTFTDGAFYGQSGTGIFEAKGNVSIGSNVDGNNTTMILRFTGSATQTLYSYYTNYFNGDIQVNKSGGQVNMISNLTMDESNQDLVIQEGMFHTNGYTLTVNGSGSTFIVENGGTFARQGKETLTGTPTFQTGSTMTYTGRNVSENITITDYGTTDYYNLTINDVNGNQATFILGANLTLSGMLNLVSGSIDAGSYVLSHNGITGTSGSYEVDLGTVNAPSSQNLGSLGLVLTSSANLGATTVEVVFTPISSGGNQGITRYYRVTPTTNTGLNATVVFNYLDSELNGLTESTLVLYESTNGTSWTAMSSTLNTSANTLSVNSVNNLDWLTAGSTAAPLPVSLLYFKAERSDQDVVLTWATASEQNNDYFTIEKSLDGEHFDVISSVFGAGNSQYVIEYNAMDMNAEDGLIFYRLSQTDFDGTTTYEKVVMVDAINLKGITRIYPMPAGDEVSFDINSDNLGIASISIVNMAGVVVLDENINLNKGQTTYRINTVNLPTGIYVVRYENGNHSAIQKIRIMH